MKAERGVFNSIKNPAGTVRALGLYSFGRVAGNFSRREYRSTGRNAASFGFRPPIKQSFQRGTGTVKYVADH